MILFFKLGLGAYGTCDLVVGLLPTLTYLRVCHYQLI